MKNLTPFEEAIKTHLDERANSDTLFAPFYGNKSKNITDCCTYIVNSVKSSARSAFTENEIYSMAIHYYTELNIKVGNPISNVRVVISKPTASGEEKPPKTILEPALKQKRVKTVSMVLQGSLFDDEL